MAKHIIDIDRLTKAQLHDLNRRVLERLRFLNAMRAHKQMLEFSVGYDLALLLEASRRTNQATRTD